MNRGSGVLKRSLTSALLNPIVNSIRVNLRVRAKTDVVSLHEPAASGAQACEGVIERGGYPTYQNRQRRPTTR